MTAQVIPDAASVKFHTWALVEIMGHQRFAGLVTEEVIAGAAFLRVDVPEIKANAAFTKLFAPGSVYAITPCTEDVARGMAESLGHQPSLYGICRSRCVPSYVPLSHGQATTGHTTTAMTMTISPASRSS